MRGNRRIGRDEFIAPGDHSREREGTRSIGTDRVFAPSERNQRVCHGHAGIGLNNVARNPCFGSTPFRAVGPVGLKHVSTSLVNPDSAKVDSILSSTTL